MKKLTLFILFVSLNAVCSAEQGFDPFPLHRGSPYEYTDGDIPDVCFFPQNKARWNGEKVAAKEWPMLTDFQKTMFISEYVKELEKQSGAAIEINGWDYLVVLNEFVSQCEGECVNRPMTDVLQDELAEEGKIKPATLRE